jgi:hypothetical protein
MEDWRREEKDIDEMKRAARVNGYLTTIEETDFSPVNGNDLAKERVGKSIAGLILEDLPEAVGTYIHSEELSFITATRHEGDTWDSAAAREWVNGILSQYGSSFKLG